MKIVADAHIPYVRDYFGSLGELVLKPGRAITHKDIQNANILLVRSITQVNQQLLEKSQIAFVGSVTAGADHLDIAWLNKNGIAWSVAQGFNAPPVADYVVCVVAALQRKQLLSQYDAKVAVIGVGEVGSLVVQRLTLLGYQTILCDPFRAEKDKDFSHTSLDAIADVDLISLHVPLTQEGQYPTHHFINESFLKRQKPGCILINTSRGAVIDSEALLSHGAHLAWCFDVWENEPEINKSLLERAIIASPHIAGYSVQSKLRGIQMIYRIVCEKKIITAKSITHLELPHQQLSFAGQQHHWQDIVMGVFNPMIMTAMMRHVLLPAETTSKLFDEMRQQFNYRHELAFTRIESDELLDFDKKILKGLGLQLIS